MMRRNLITDREIVDKTKSPKFSVEDSPNYYIYSIGARSFFNLTNALRPYSLGPPAWRVLANLQENDGVSLRGLARRTTIDVSNLSKLINTLSKQGLVRKKHSENDARVVLTFITDKGRQKFESALPVVRQVQEQGLSGFRDRERVLFMDFLKRMMKNVSI